jgi:hypothetical protein
MDSQSVGFGVAEGFKTRFPMSLYKFLIQDNSARVAIPRFNNYPCCNRYKFICHVVNHKMKSMKVGKNVKMCRHYFIF